MTRILVACLLLGFAATGFAQSADALRVGVIVSEGGGAAEAGALQRRVAEAFAVRQRGRGGIFGAQLVLEVRSDASSPAQAEEVARELIDGGVHALVCCTTTRAGDRVAPLAADRGVVLVAPSGAAATGGGGWHHALDPGDRTQLRAMVRDAYARNWRGLGLLGPDDDAFSAAQRILEEELATAQMALVASAAFAADADAVTPEALWVATRQPGAVVVWGSATQSRRAVAALRRRGWDGPVYLRGALLAASGPAALPDGARVPVAPALLPAAAVPEGHASAVRDARVLGAGEVGTTPYRAEGARMHDALALLATAFEDAVSYGVPPAEIASFRQALRDALVTVPATALAAGTYDPDERGGDVTLPDGFPVAVVRGGNLLAP